LGLAFLAGSVFVPWLQDDRPSTATLLRLAYTPLCHQLPDRSLVLGSAHQAVCARCSGLYLGGILGLVVGGAWIVGRHSPGPWWLLAASAPTMIDLALPWFGLPALTNVPRLIVAVPAGLAAGVFLAIGVYDLFDRSARFASHALNTPAVSHIVEESDG
jgi:uncharacterized membrane protein